MTTEFTNELDIRVTARTTTPDPANTGTGETPRERPATPTAYDIVDQASTDSFPPSDPPGWIYGPDPSTGKSSGNG